MVRHYKASDVELRGRLGYGVRYVAEVAFRESTENGMFIHVKIPGGMITSPHSHEILEEVFVAIDTTVMGVGSEVLQLEEGDVVLVEPGEPHWFEAPEEHDVRVIAIKFPNIDDDKVEHPD
ncbi:MAG: cupin domain-containing protein [Candidatus Thorarchaeota archaeon]|nr:MAG: cupin domain-containing protein [Candidatus Thorarchaeota archaeon]